ncbi:P-loop containing nucleoside triphosphate hydrolase protein [Gaertneriomyces semiglobifer]|nr:P-loop containing nucleoside triphosphate hydrolase protein [Gaertneriomyces semiglobifer]
MTVENKDDKAVYVVTSDTGHDIEAPEVKPEPVVINPGFFSYITVSWLTPVMRLGARRPLVADDLYRLNPKNRAQSISGKLHKFWEAVERGEQPRLHWFLLRALAVQFTLAGIYYVISAACSLLLPVFIEQILRYAKGLDAFINNGYGLAFTAFGLQMGYTLFGRLYDQMVRQLMLCVRTLLTDAVISKSLRVGKVSSAEHPPGKIIALVNVDVEQVVIFMFVFCQLWGTPIQISVALVLIHNMIGNAVWAGIGVLLGSLALQNVCAVFIAKGEKSFLVANDKRLREIREMLQGIKVVKFRACEEWFLRNVDETRAEQLKGLKRVMAGVMSLVSISQLTPVLLPITAFIIYGKSNVLDATVIFPALALFNLLTMPMLQLPQAFSNLIMCVVSLKRLRTFLILPEEPTNWGNVDTNYKPEDAIVFDDAEFEWTTEPPATSKSARKQAKKDKKKKQASNDESADTVVTRDPFKLSLDLKIPKGSLTAIVGPVGAGKSSFLAALLSEMRCLKGAKHVQGPVALCTQQPWLLTTSIAKNVTFMEDRDEKRMLRALDVCALNQDLAGLPDGVETEIGERGLNLSGGQKARVALARAVYAQADTYMLDDVFSALDAVVAEQIFEDCILGELNGKTRVVVTHQLQFLKKCDYVIVMQNGKAVEYGTYDDLNSRDGALTELMNAYSSHNTNDNGEDTDVDSDEDDKDAASVKAQDPEAKGGKAEGVMQAEEQFTGAISWATYKHYMDFSGGWPVIAATVLFMSAYQACTITANYWLTWWTDDKYNKDNGFYMATYGALGAAQTVSLVIMNAVVIVGAFYVSKRIHPTALRGVAYATMSFLDSQPIGRLMNRFAGDVDVIDNMLWGDYFIFTFGLFNVLGTGILISIGSPYMLILFGILCVLYVIIFNWFRRSYRQLKRLSSTGKSPVNACINESLSGTLVIRAFGAEESIKRTARSCLDQYNTPWFHMNLAEIWMTNRIEILSAFVILCLILLGINDVIRSTVLGLTLSYAISLTQSVNMLLRSGSRLESNMNAVERLVHYCYGLPQEPAHHKDNDPPEGTWPSSGKLDIKDVQLKYATGPMILKGVSINIKPGEKVGIVGRTGSGKSTLLQALFRLVESQEGDILVDGIPIKSLGLHTLRSRLQILPQEPTLFTGTIRSNLGLMHSFTDDALWNALESVELKEYVSTLPLKLDAPVTENGDNLSVGQRQLLCLARSILMNPTVLVMDEATASVDVVADAAVQRSIRTHFARTTVLTIAHRLNSVADLDQVIVMDDGKVVEFGTPWELLEREGGEFRKLAEAMGSDGFAGLKDVAFRRYQLTHTAI